MTEGAYLLGAALALDAACGEHLPQLLDLVGAEAVVEAEVGVEAEAEVEVEWRWRCGGWGRVAKLKLRRAEV